MSNKKIQKPERPTKHPDLLVEIRSAVKSGNYLDVVHAQQRSTERSITRPEYEWVLMNGWHEKAKDAYQERYKNWNYAIRGKTVDDRELRVVVSFEENGLLIITLIDLEDL